MKLQLTIGILLSSLALNVFAQDTVLQQLATLESSFGGKIGISAVDTGTKQKIQYRGKERFPFCSTFKLMGVSAVLKKSMSNKELLQDKITYTKQDIVPYSPMTEKHITDGMTVAELCKAAITLSDDTAINLLMKKIGGLDSVNHFARSIGDKEFHLDRWEVDLNTAIPGDKRDTTTPIAMQQSLQKVALGNALAKPQQMQLQEWLKANTTGEHRIRASVPQGWVVGDKTGTGDYGTANDIAVIWPAKCDPIVMTIYVTQNKKDAAPVDEVIAKATTILINEFAKQDKCIAI